MMCLSDCMNLNIIKIKYVSSVKVYKNDKLCKNNIKFIPLCERHIYVCTLYFKLIDIFKILKKNSMLNRLKYSSDM